MKIVRYRVRKASGHYLIVDTHTKHIVANHTDATDAHMHAGTMNYKYRLARGRRHSLHSPEHAEEPINDHSVRR
jgi:hypothetical protein